MHGFRSPVRSLLTIGSVTMCLSLMMILLSFLAVIDANSSNLAGYNRLVVLSSQGFAQPVPFVRVREISEMKGVIGASTFAWFGGKYNGEIMPFAQFGVVPETFFTIYDEYKVPPDQLKAFKEEKMACAIGRKLRRIERGLKLGDPLPLSGTIYSLDLNLTIRAIYDGLPKRDLRTGVFHLGFLKRGTGNGLRLKSKMLNNAGSIALRLRVNGSNGPAHARN